uniref:Laminin EGF-like domain-containing protein n=1 Tax=Ascaris lumbricoides TaxID=6252 RepID=A0A0M3HL46_ASCLU
MQKFVCHKLSSKHSLSLLFNQIAALIFALEYFLGEFSLSLEKCHPTIGACSCRAGFTGASCDSICPLSYYGENCAKKCDCALGTGSQCDPVNGTCFCAPGYRGPR